MRKFTKEHEWISVEGDIATVGITTYAAKELGDITFVEIPEIDSEIEAGDVFTVVESVKAASDVFAPISGKIVEVNEILEDNPEILNSSPETEGWICKIKISDPSKLDTLMDEEEYKSYITSL